MLLMRCEKYSSVVVCGGGMCGRNFWCGDGGIFWYAVFRVATLDSAGDNIIYSLFNAAIKSIFNLGFCGGKCVGTEPCGSGRR